MTLVPRLLRKLGLTRRRAASPPAAPPPDLAPADLDIIDRVRPFTMTSVERLAALIDATRFLARQRVPGAFAECGVWRGGSMMAAALTLLDEGEPRDLYLFDTYSGMTPPTGDDVSFDGVPAALQLARTPRGEGAWCAAGFDEVKANLAATGYPAELLHFVAGPVEETLPRQAPASLALLRLDTDWYGSTRHELLHLYPRLVRRGVLIIDDYGHWRGARHATDEYFAACPDPILLQRIDYTGRIGVKS
jgi:O-methyltransferase